MQNQYKELHQYKVGEVINYNDDNYNIDAIIDKITYQLICRVKDDIRGNWCKDTIRIGVGSLQFVTSVFLAESKSMKEEIEFF